MTKKYSTFMGIMALCSFFSLARIPVYADDEATKAAVVGQAAPALTASTLDGKKFDLSTLRDKVVVIHMWATWCPPCREEMPSLEAVWRQYHSKGLEVLAISADRPRTRGDVDQVMHLFTFPAAMLSALSKNDFGAPTSIPVTYVIDKSGKIAVIMTPDTNPLTEAALSQTVKGLLETKAETTQAPKDEAKAPQGPENKP